MTLKRFKLLLNYNIIIYLVSDQKYIASSVHQI